MPRISTERLLDNVARAEGFADALDMLEQSFCDSMGPAVCTECEEVYVMPLEHDARDVLCDNCGHKTVQSVFVLGEVI